MFCPNCRTEYVAGITRCKDCDVELVDELAPPSVEQAQWRDLETVLESADPARIAVIRSLLEAEQIPCIEQNGLSQDLIGLGRMPSGENFALGPTRLQVPAEMAESARALIADYGSELPADAEPSDS